MKFSKIFKISAMTIGVTIPASATVLSATSCGHKAPKPILPINIDILYWSNFVYSAKHESAFKIVSIVKPTSWLTADAATLKIDSFKVNKNLGTITTTITNTAPHSTATFSIIFKDKITYNVKNWKYNNDVENKFSLNSSFAPNAAIQTIQTMFTIANPITGNNWLDIVTPDKGVWTSKVDDPTKTFKQLKIENNIPEGVTINKVVNLNDILYFLTSNGIYELKKDVFNTSHILDKQNVTNMTFVYPHTTAVMIDNTKLLVSYDLGKTFKLWTVATTVPTGTEVSQILTIKNGNTYVATNKGLWVNRTGLSGFGPTLLNINIKSMFETKDMVYFTTDNNILYQAPLLGKKDLVFSKITKGFPNNMPTINNIVEINYNVYVCTEQGLYISTDNKVFVLNKQINEEYKIKNVTLINGEIYAITSNQGSLVSADNGKTFISLLFTDHIEHDNTITSFNYIADTGTMFIATTGNGLWNN